MQHLRIVFMGTPEFAVETLKGLVENGLQVVGVVTVPDKPSGRGQKIVASPVKQYAESQQIPVLQPVKLKDPDFLQALRLLKADIQVIVAFRMLPEVVWSMPPMGSINLHGSLLPQYRGAAPINWAVINGETETGVTTFLLQHEIDTGNVLFQEKIPIFETDDAGSVHDGMMKAGARLIIQTLDALAGGEIKPIAQEALAMGRTLHTAPKIFKEDMRLDWNQPASALHNKVRGLSPYPAAWTEWTTQTGEAIGVKIFETRLVPDSLLRPAQLATDGKNYIQIGALDGALEIVSLQMAGKKRMAVSEFLKGFRNPQWQVLQ